MIVITVAPFLWFSFSFGLGGLLHFFVHGRHLSETIQEQKDLDKRH